MRGLSFIEPHVMPVAEIIQAAIKRMPPKGNIGGTDLLLLRGLVGLLRDSENLVLHAQKFIEGYGPATILDALLTQPIVEIVSSEASQADNSNIDKNEPALPKVIPSVPVTQLTSMGLW